MFQFLSQVVLAPRFLQELKSEALWWTGGLCLESRMLRLPVLWFAISPYRFVETATKQDICIPPLLYSLNTEHL